MEFANEYTILKESKKRQFTNLLHLDGLLLSLDFMALRVPKYEMTLREYIYDRRNAIELKDILLSMIEGVRELHDTGFIHRDLKPDNVMVSFAPLKVAVIDFNRAVRKENISAAMVLGTHGYFPVREKWVNGSV